MKKHKRNRLKGTLTYLVGPMEAASDGGVEWRMEMQNFLWGLGIGVLNPCDKAIGKVPEKEIAAKILALREKARKNNDPKIYDKIQSLCKKHIVRPDLRMVDIAHFTVMYIDKDVHMCGSYNEQAHAVLQRKPVVICCKQGKHNLPYWLYGVCNHNMIFDSWEEVKEYLLHVAHDKSVKTYNRWRFFDFNKVFNIKE